MAAKAWCCWPKWEGLWPPGTFGPLYSGECSCLLPYLFFVPSLCIGGLTSLCVDTRLLSLRTNQPKLVCDFLPGLSIYYYASRTPSICFAQLKYLWFLMTKTRWHLYFANHVSLKDWFVIRDWTFLSSNHPESYPRVSIRAQRVALHLVCSEMLHILKRWI